MRIMFCKLYFISFLSWCFAHKTNFLLIIVDDLNTSLGCYGDKNAYTPNIDRLATNSAIFSQAFAQQALCAPSRNSFLTSKRPDTLQLYDFYSYWRNTVGNFTTLPQYMKNLGYVTKSAGKVFHPGISSNYSDDSPYSWTSKPFHPSTDKFKDAPVCQTNLNSPPARNLVCPVNVDLMPNKTLPDIETLNEAKRFIRDQKTGGDPFFLAVGFQKPHIPLKYPEKYRKYHPLYKFHLPNPYKWPNNVSSIAYNPWTDLRKREDIKALNLKFPWERIPDYFSKLIIQSYYSAVTYIDDLIGKLISQLEASSLRRNTVIILMSDHGWSLGEHATWAKYSNFDVATRVPLLISVPTLTFGKPYNDPTKSNIPCHLKWFSRNLRQRLKGGTENPISDRRDNERKKYVKNEQITNLNFTAEERTVFRKLQWRYPKQIRRLEGCKNRLTDYRNINGNEMSDENISWKQKGPIIIDALVELVDIFPTVADLAHNAVPICVHEKTKNGVRNNYTSRTEVICSEGISLVPILRTAARSKSIPWKKAAFSQYPRPSIEPSWHPNSDEPRLKEIKAMGYTLKTKRYRYTVWLPFDSETMKPTWSTTIAEELYDHRIDETENLNVAGLQKYLEAKKSLRTLLQKGWPSALPKEASSVLQFLSDN